MFLHLDFLHDDRYRIKFEGELPCIYGANYQNRIYLDTMLLPPRSEFAETIASAQKATLLSILNRHNISLVEAQRKPHVKQAAFTYRLQLGTTINNIKGHLHVVMGRSSTLTKRIYFGNVMSVTKTTATDAALEMLAWQSENSPA